MRLIDANKLKRKVQRVATEAWMMKLTSSVETVLNQFLDYIEEAPSIDIVRCGECKHWREYETWSECERWTGNPYESAKTKADDFCSYGSRSEKPSNCELQTIRCPKCGRTDYIRDMEKDMGIKGSHYKYKCINCNTYIKDEPKTEREGE